MVHCYLCKTDKKASLLSSTLLISFIFFFPSFCLFKSFIFLDMSPPYYTKDKATSNIPQNTGLNMVFQVILSDQNIKGDKTCLRVFCYTPLGVSQLVSYYTPPHSMTVFILITVYLQCYMIQHSFVTTVISIISYYKKSHGMRREECNMILPVTHL